MKANNLRVIGGVLAGVAVGTIVGLLTAPDSGKKTLKKLDNKAKDLKQNVGEAVNVTLNKINDSYDELISQVKSVQSKVSEKDFNGKDLISKS